MNSGKVPATMVAVKNQVLEALTYPQRKTASGKGENPDAAKNATNQEE